MAPGAPVGNRGGAVGRAESAAEPFERLEAGFVGDLGDGSIGLPQAMGSAFQTDAPRQLHERLPDEAPEGPCEVERREPRRGRELSMPQRTFTVGQDRLQHDPHPLRMFFGRAVPHTSLHTAGAWVFAGSRSLIFLAA